MILPVFILSVTGAVFSTETQITKRDGETVTLQMNKSMIPVKDYLWTFGRDNPITAITIVTNGEVTRVNGTRFENRLYTHVETASVSISNLTISDSGIFLAQVFTETGILTQRFNLTVLDNSVIPVNVLEGTNVTLDPGVKQLQKEHTVSWTQGPDCVGKLIAQWKNFNISIEESFVGVVQLNPHTGSLTVIRVTQNYTGFYCGKMLWGREPYILRRYFITVFEPVSRPHISTAQANISTHSLNDENCYLNCSVKNGPGVSVSWYRGGKKINQTSNKDISSNLTLPLVIRNQDEGIFSCVAANPVSMEALTVNSTLWCPPHGTDLKRMLSIIGGIAVSVVLVIVVACLYKRRYKEGAWNCMHLRNMPEGMPSEATKVSEGGDGAVEQDVLLPNN
ncbi:titin-like [Pagrus major]|uniref:titin-like n=1 Tax=Pagrus major TaxID=143350 RepID=UPI003CC8E052